MSRELDNGCFLNLSAQTIGLLQINGLVYEYEDWFHAYLNKGSKYHKPKTSNVTLCPLFASQYTVCDEQILLLLMFNNTRIIDSFLNLLIHYLSFMNHG